MTTQQASTPAVSEKQAKLIIDMHRPTPLRSYLARCAKIDRTPTRRVRRALRSIDFGDQPTPSWWHWNALHIALSSVLDVPFKLYSEPRGAKSQKESRT
jgi:hypothetical protein